jgi:hypothetical protein
MYVYVLDRANRNMMITVVITHEPRSIECHARSPKEGEYGREISVAINVHQECP